MKAKRDWHGRSEVEAIKIQEKMKREDAAGSLDFQNLEQDAPRTDWDRVSQLR
jgi:hypothetical protein